MPKKNTDEPGAVKAPEPDEPVLKPSRDQEILASVGDCACIKDNDFILRPKDLVLEFNVDEQGRYPATYHGLIIIDGEVERRIRPSWVAYLSRAYKPAAKGLSVEPTTLYLVKLHVTFQDGTKGYVYKFIDGQHRGMAVALLGSTHPGIPFISVVYVDLTIEQRRVLFDFHAKTATYSKGDTLHVSRAESDVYALWKDTPPDRRLATIGFGGEPYDKQSKRQRVLWGAILEAYWGAYQMGPVPHSVPLTWRLPTLNRQVLGRIWRDPVLGQAALMSFLRILLILEITQEIGGQIGLSAAGPVARKVRTHLKETDGDVLLRMIHPDGARTANLRTSLLGSATVLRVLMGIYRAEGEKRFIDAAPRFVKNLRRFDPKGRNCANYVPTRNEILAMFNHGLKEASNSVVSDQLSDA